MYSHPQESCNLSEGVGAGLRVERTEPFVERSEASYGYGLDTGGGEVRDGYGGGVMGGGTGGGTGGGVRGAYGGG